MSETNFQTATLKVDPDYNAPDGSEIRLLQTISGGGLCHCTLPMGKTSSAVAHQKVEEIWYFLEGNGEVWRESEGNEEIVSVRPGTSLTIPPRTAFQFRNTGSGPLRMLIATMPAWPGAHEAVQVNGVWPAI